MHPLPPVPVSESPSASPSTAAKPSLSVAALFEREYQPNRFQDWRFRLLDVQIDEGQFGPAARVLRDDGKLALLVFPGLTVTLHRDESEGYHLNLTSGAPAWFVMWRVAEDDPSALTPERVTLSYNEAGRLLDAQELVDNLPLPTDVLDWLQAYTDAHYVLEAKQRRRPQSFKAPDQR